MATHGVSFCDSFDVTTSATAAYDCPAAITRAVITKALAVNYTSTAQTITIYVDADGTGTASLNIKVETLTVPANTTDDNALVIDELAGIGLAGGGRISALASANTSISLTITGTTYP